MMKYLLFPTLLTNRPSGPLKTAVAIYVTVITYPAVV